MKTRIICIILLILFASMPTYAQKSDHKSERERKRLEKKNEIASLIEKKTFDFRANRAIPTGFRSMDLTTNPNFIQFSPDFIRSEMPYFGRAYSVPYGGDGGLKFDGKPEEFNVVRKKNNYSIEAKVKANGDYFTINLTVGFEGSSTLSVFSNNRASISYNGEIFQHKEQKEEN